MSVEGGVMVSAGIYSCRKKETSEKTIEITQRTALQ